MLCVCGAILSLCSQTHKYKSTQEDEFLRILKKLNIDFVNFCKECWSYCSVRPPCVRLSSLSHF